MRARSIHVQMAVSFCTRHFLVYTTCLQYQRIEERTSKVGIDGRHTRYVCHIVPGIDYNYGESIVHRWLVRAQLSRTAITIDGARVHSLVMKVSASAALCARINCPSHATCWCEQARASDSSALLVKRPRNRVYISPECKNPLGSNDPRDRFRASSSIEELSENRRIARQRRLRHVYYSQKLIFRR